MTDLRKIIHIDMDAFYASVEQRDRPDLRGKPIAVGGGGARGVVASASYEARRYGVRSAMSGRAASRLCPDLIFVKARFDAYVEASRQIRAIFQEYTELVEPLSLDEAYLDVTTPLQGPASATLIAAEIRKRIYETTGLTASAGISFNKFLAKVASDINKPNGMKVILPEEAMAFLAVLPIEKFHGIGKVTANRMRSRGIACGADLRQFDELSLIKWFGKMGAHYYRIVRAEDQRPVNPGRIRKSIGTERTFKEDIGDPDQLAVSLEAIARQLFEEMERKSQYGRTLTLKWKTPAFRIFNRSCTFPTSVRQWEALRSAALSLLRDNQQTMGYVRLLGLSVSNLEQEQAHTGRQLLLPFAD